MGKHDSKKGMMPGKAAEMDGIARGAGDQLKKEATVYPGNVNKGREPKGNPGRKK